MSGIRSVIPAALLAVATAGFAAPLAAAPSPTPAAAAAAPTDPARLAAARQTVDFVFPAGTYARIMNDSMDKLMDSLMDSMMHMPIKDLAGISGVDASKLSSASMEKIMEIYDPAFRDRMKLSTRAMMSEMSGIMTEFEPEIRDGLAQAYAEKFDTRQLGEMNGFFATPTGRAYAADSYLIMMSPQVMTKMQAFLPRMMQQMPAIMEKVQAATASLPPVRSYAQLDKAEKARLAEVLGISEAELEEQETAKAP